MMPNFPIYIVSKGRANTRHTMKALERMNVPYSVVVEEQEYAAYAEVIEPTKLLVLDKEYQRLYDTCDDLGDSKTKGSGAARNFAWDHSMALGHEWHWLIDDNIRHFYRLNRNIKVPVRDGVFFRVIEDFVLRYTNVGMAGPQYEKFIARKMAHPPFQLNTRIYSCNLIRNSLPFRWRGRYNEDTDLSLRLLKAGWVTMLFNAYLAEKITTQKVKGGNTAELYKGGTLPKSQMIANLHPDVARVVWRYNRWHHEIDYSPFRDNLLIRRNDLVIPEGVNEYGMRLINLKEEGNQ